MDRFAISFSWRYGVVGIYKDRAWPLIHVYPLPFIKLSFSYHTRDEL